jgi:uncharacterized damage-inducible protein DinB
MAGYDAPMDRDSLLVFVRYHAWANDRIMSTASSLSDDALREPARLDHGTAFDTVRHLVDVDWSWRELCTGHDVGQTYVWDHGFALDDMGALHAFTLEEDARLRRYVESLDQPGLDEPVALGEDPDDTRPRWLILAHVVNHGTNHRTELARFLTDRGHSPGDLDLLDAPTLAWPSA